MGRKIEIRLKLKQTELWCFEGTIVELKEESDGKEQKLSLRSEHAVARVHWDECFHMHDSDHTSPEEVHAGEGPWRLELAYCGLCAVSTGATTASRARARARARGTKQHARSEFLDAQAEAA